MMAVLQDATKALKTKDAVHLYNLMLDNVTLNATVSHYDVYIQQV